jgi:hypothetical protein
VPLPKRLGLTTKPTFISLVLVSRTARISRPKAKIDGLDAVIKNDQLNARISKDIDAKFCWFNKPRFGGLVYRMDCQTKVLKAERIRPLCLDERRHPPPRSFTQ